MIPQIKTVAFDFDGVISKYAGYVAKDDVQEPIVEVVKAIKILKEKGFKILVHSTRGDEFLKNYCDTYNIPYDYINRRPDRQGDNPGKPVAYVYVDDRAICYQGQSAEDLVHEIDTFKSYWEV
jgi:phosphoglycolate phosphatase-like HAD superfamily hydrolase